MRAFVIYAACIIAASVASTTQEAADLSQGDELSLPVVGTSLPGKISLVELKEKTLDAIAGTATMTDDDMDKAKSQFMSMMFDFQGQKMRTASLVASRLAESAFAKQDGSGLDLIFRKLNELEKKITDEQKQETTTHVNEQASCGVAIAKLEDALSTASDNQKQLRSDSDQGAEIIAKNRVLWRESRNTEDATHKLLVALQKDRAERIDAVTARVDERNRALDVMVKALFMVCENFNRFKNSELCIRIKSQPDVDEPLRYSTNPPDEAEKETRELHAKDGQWEADWKKQEEKDVKFTDDGVKHPEGGPIHDTQAAASSQEDLDEMKKEVNTAEETKPNGKRKLLAVENDESEMTDLIPSIPHEKSLAKVMAADDEKKFELSEHEGKVQKELEKMASKQMPDKYKMPLVELAVAIKEGQEKKSKNIVEILMDVIHITREEQANDKQKHTENLDSDFAQSWDYKTTMNNEAANQLAWRTQMEDERLGMLKDQKDAEQLRQGILKDGDAKMREEDRCAKAAEIYGVAEGMRVEDLENLVKLKSLLRMLYFKKKPLNCRRNSDTKALCSGMDRGWCVFEDKHPKNDQRCSCNKGFYGAACEYTMCPGLAQNLYRHDAVGVCSSQEGKAVRGTCNKMTGLCTCNVKKAEDGQTVESGFYHGPKRACDYAYAPPSKNGQVDNQCSERGRPVVNEGDPDDPNDDIKYGNGYDKVRGNCHCQTGFWGGGCEFKKCPGGAVPQSPEQEVLYPSTSSNACAGRGACSDETGKCACPWPFRGRQCEFEDCPGDCRGSGKESCKTDTGKCQCKAPTWGHECEYLGCPEDCNGTGGECNRNDGKCICKMGYSGTTCQQTKRCTAKEELHEDSMNWWTIWDKPGWITCPHGQLLHQLRRTGCSALSCIDSGACAAGCEGDKHVFATRHCYHDLRWYNSFDGRGWSKCLPDYFVAGLYRSCESLYCLNLAKCCSLKEARWTECKEANWEPIFNGPGTGKVPNDVGFITGFYRDVGHTLKDIDKASYCGFVRGY